MPDTPDESLVRAVLAEHGEDYDSDCRRHFGCKCRGATLTGNYWESDAFARRREAWLDHVMEKMREPVMADPAPAKCVPNGGSDDEGDRRCLTHRVWWPDEAASLCPEASRGA